MEISVIWQQPIILKDGAKENLIYNCSLERISDKAGIYIFARTHGQVVSPIYIGQAKNLRARIKQQLNYTPLMKGIENSQTGKRILLVGILDPGKAQQQKKLLNILEKTYIENAFTGGHDLLNKKGTKTPFHTILSEGKKEFHKPFPRIMKSKIKV